MLEKPTKNYEKFRSLKPARTPAVHNSITLRGSWASQTALRATYYHHHYSSSYYLPLLLLVEAWPASRSLLRPEAPCMRGLLQRAVARWSSPRAAHGERG